MYKFKGFYQAVVLLVLSALLLAACGDTATPVATTAAATTTAATTATKAATTTTAATTVAATTAATTTAATTTAAATTTTAAVATTATTTAATATTSASGTGSSFTLPAITGATEVNLNPTIATALKSGLQAQAKNVSDLDARIFVSDSDPATLSKAADTALTGAGYASAIPGSSPTVKQGNALAAFYAKSGSPDLFLVFGDPTTGLGISGLDAKTLSLLSSDISGKKGIMFLVSGTGLISALQGAGAGLGGATTTAAAMTATGTDTTGTTTTAGSATTSASGTGSSSATLPTIPSATEVVLSSAIMGGIATGFTAQIKGVNDLNFQLFSSDTDADTFTTGADKALTDAGYAFAVPGATKPIKQGDATLAFYSKSGSPDLFLIIGDPNKGLGLPGLDASNLSVVSSDLKNKKTVMFVVSGTGLIKAFGTAAAGAAGSAATPSPTP